MSMTDQERLDVVEETIKLIRNPENWVKGEWKCELVRDSHGAIVPKTKFRGGEPYLDRQGRQQYGYCIEGAVNQAAINVLGMDRASSLKAARRDGEPAHSSDFADRLSINEIARELFGTRNKDDILVSALDGMLMSDMDASQTINDAEESTHADVLKILRKRARNLRASLKAAA